MRNSVRAALAVSALVAATTQAMAGGQICAPSNAVGLEGIGDGCSTSIAGYVFPEIGIFRPTFTSSCNRHDKCMTTLGATYSSCDSQFLSDMLSACKSSFNPLFFPAEYAACTATANAYYDGVEAWGEVVDPLPGFQADALKRSQAMGRAVDIDGSCGTAPERTTLYTSGLIAKINGSFQTNAGRQPTIFEFFNAVNANTSGKNYVTDNAWWESNLVAYARKQASVKPPAVGYLRSDGVSAIKLTANPLLDTSIYSYQWKANFLTSTSTSISFPLQRPKYDRDWKIEGFETVKDKAGVKNMKVIDENVHEQGTCRDVPGGPCN